MLLEVLIAVVVILLLARGIEPVVARCLSKISPTPLPPDSGPGHTTLRKRGPEPRKSRLEGAMEAYLKGLPPDETQDTEEE